MGGKIAWREWSDESFQTAEREGKLVLLDLTASWCHWCHVMDDTTYSDDAVARLINDNFVPVRVDIDRRPDISERYNRGGFPTTAFLSHSGDAVWGATYIPPADMRRVLEGLLRAKRAGEIDQALARAGERARTPKMAPSGRGLPSEGELGRLMSGMMDSFDPVHGGFGDEPKFPNPDAVDLLITRHAVLGDRSAASAASLTLARMAEGLYDGAEGGVFRYSVTRDWSVPHYEKMLETNLGYLRNLARAQAALGTGDLSGLAEGVAGYLLTTLRDPATGAFFGSQDADEEYYRLPLKARSKRPAPSVDRAVYSGWNALASSVLVEAGALLARPDLVGAGLGALDRVMETHWDGRMGLVAHSEGQGLFLSEDQVELLGALLSAMEVRGTERTREPAEELIRAVAERFAHRDGGIGDVVADPAGIGSLAHPVRSLVTNSRWAHRLALAGAALGRTDLLDQARGVLASFDTATVLAHGPFSAPFIAAADSLMAGPLKVEVHSSLARPWEDPLWVASKRAMDPRVVTLFVADGGGFAVACTEEGCSAKIRGPDELLRALRRPPPGQV